MKVKDMWWFVIVCFIMVVIKDCDIVMCVFGYEQISDEDILQVLVKMIKQCEELMKIYVENGCVDFVDQECEEMEIICSFMLEQFLDEKVCEICVVVIVEMGVVGFCDMGKCVVLFKECYFGQMDFGKVFVILKDLLK